MDEPRGTTTWFAAACGDAEEIMENAMGPLYEQVETVAARPLRKAAAMATPLEVALRERFGWRGRLPSQAASSFPR